MSKAPDKIYMNVDRGGFVCWSKTQFVKPYSSTEYIRKAALLEWLKEELEHSGPTTLVQHIINKINSL